MTRHAVCAVDELRPGDRMIIELGGRSIGVFNVDGRRYALRNMCPHQGAPLCTGTLSGTMLPSDPHRYVYGRKGHVLRCPWHGWEFDIETGISLFDPRKRVRSYPVTVDDDVLVIDV